MITDSYDRLILALDVSSADQAKLLLDRVGDAVRFVKIGLELFTAGGPDIVRWAVQQNKRVFLDLKLLDIGETVKRATGLASELGVAFFSVHTTSQAVRAALEGRGQSSMKILAVTVLTSFAESDLQENGIEESVHNTVLKRAHLAHSSGADGVVASGDEAAMIRKEVSGRLIIVTPGIRLEDSSHHDHRRVCTPAMALAAGADYLVVGRPIRDAADPAAAARAVQAEIAAACAQNASPR